MNSESTENHGLDTFEHVVVLMLENRSFDNLLGYLYKQGDVPSGKKYAGLDGHEIEMPVPDWAKDFKEHPFVKPSKATNYHQPFPDPGEVYQHVNTQLFNYISEGNCRVDATDMVTPYNIPNPTPDPPPMTGFVKDYINTLSALTGHKSPPYHDPGFDLYSVIMQCFEPDQTPVMSTLAKEFAVFDHWHCSVPSQTWCNRAFWHAGTSGGKVANPTGIKSMYSWMKDVWSQDTIFTRMKEKQISHAVYTENPVSLTSLVNGPFQHEHVIRTGDQLSRFKHDIKHNKLPQYAFIEPKFIGKHNDQHPSSLNSHLVDPLNRVGTVLLGEQLIWDVYNTIKNSDDYRDNTLLIITHDEHGGCFDHVSPPEIDPTEPPGQMGFPFNRLGVRVPMVMVSAYLDKNTIVNETYEHSSFIKTMCEKWDLKGLTQRAMNARSFGSIFSHKKRTDFPDIPEPVIPQGDDSDYLHDELSDFQQSILVGAHFMANKHSDPDSMGDVLTTVKTVGDAMEYIETIKNKLS